MRKGQNPAKFVDQVARPKDITVAALTYIPFLSGYFAHSLEVLKACLTSLWEATDLPHDLMVFDNGSCPEVVGFLEQARSEGKIQFLILSDRNLGKGGAWNVIFEAAPGEIIAYTDSDALFYPGWLSHSAEILKTYPNVGMVTARPFRTPNELFTSTLEWAARNPDVTLETGHFIPWEEFLSFVASLGTTEQQAQDWYANSRDIRVTYRGVRAQVGASHWQFTAYKSRLKEFLPFDMSRPMRQVRELDRRMNEAGYLRLMTDSFLAQNMSNRVPAASEASSSARPPFKPAGRKLAEMPVIKRLLLRLHDAIFRLYYD